MINETSLGIPNPNSTLLTPMLYHYYLTTALDSYPKEIGTNPLERQLSHLTVKRLTPNQQEEDLRAGD